jgi:hypothetical protein
MARIVASWLKRVYATSSRHARQGRSAFRCVDGEQNTGTLYLKDAQVHTRRRLTRPESISLVDDVPEATVARNERRCLWASS